MQPVLFPHAVPAAPPVERIAKRSGVGLPYMIDGQQGHTSDLSAIGLAFESSTCHAGGEEIMMAVHYGRDGHNVPLPCEVQVAWVEFHGDPFKIGARLTSPFFEAEA
jgi:hypothetical protein